MTTDRLQGHEVGERAAQNAQMLDSQSQSLARLRAQLGEPNVSLVDVSLVTGSVQVTVRVKRARRRAHVAVIAPSGRVHRL